MRKFVYITLIAMLALITLVPVVVSAAPTMQVATLISSADGVGYSYQRNSFYAEGRHWLFYFDGTTDLRSWYTSSVTGAWAAPSLMCNGSIGPDISLWYEDPYVHVVFLDSGEENSPIYYIMGQPYSDGTIGWLTPPQTVIAGGGVGDYYLEPSITVRPAPYNTPVIGYTYFDSGVYVPSVAGSLYGNGTWADDNDTSSGDISGDASTGRYVCVVPWSDGSIHISWVNMTEAAHLRTISARIWNPTTFWGSAELVTGSDTLENGYESLYSVVAINRSVNIVYREDANPYIRYRVRNPGATWMGNNAPVTVYSTEGVVPALAEYDSDGSLALFLGNTTIKWLIQDGLTGVWDTTPTILMTGTKVTSMTCSRSYSSPIGVAWTDNVPGTVTLNYTYITPYVDTVDSTTPWSGASRTILYLIPTAFIMVAFVFLVNALKGSGDVTSIITMAAAAILAVISFVVISQIVHTVGG